MPYAQCSIAEVKTSGSETKVFKNLDEIEEDYLSECTADVIYCPLPTNPPTNKIGRDSIFIKEKSDPLPHSFIKKSLELLDLQTTIRPTDLKFGGHVSFVE
ncbi:hypothetical protein TNCV_4863451 [Trichonephila clavipes]|nr:hypothetical protein TNCV_4863451 [Trichonephila clavipes]